MYGITVPSDARWTYDDPAGIPDEVTIGVRIPEPLLDEVQREAAAHGVTPAGWLLDLIDRALHLPRTA